MNVHGYVQKRSTSLIHKFSLAKREWWQETKMLFCAETFNSLNLKNKPGLLPLHISFRGGGETLKYQANLSCVNIILVTTALFF